MAKSLAKRALTLFKGEIVRQSAYSEVQNALNLLRPIQTEHLLVRLGPEGDGGYLIPNDLEGIVHLFSPGVGDEWGFEQDLFSTTGAAIDMIESGFPNRDCPFAVTAGRLGGFTGFGQVGTDSWIKQCNPEPNGDFVLSMDIEGAEYQVLLGISENLLRRFRIITIEFHNLQRLADRNWLLDTLLPVVLKITTHFIPVHAHANNAGPLTNVHGFMVPNLLEMTFLRRDRIMRQGSYAKIPNKLDTPCDFHKPEIDLIRLWG